MATIPVGAEIFIIPTVIHPFSWPLSQRVKQPGRETDLSLPSPTQFKKARKWASTFKLTMDTAHFRTELAKMRIKDHCELRQRKSDLFFDNAAEFKYLETRGINRKYIDDRRAQFRKYVVLLGPKFFIFPLFILKREILKYTKFEFYLSLSKYENFEPSH